MKPLISLLLIISINVATHGQKSTTVDPRFTGVDTELQKLLDTWKAAGFAVAVVEKNKVIYAKGLGYRDVDRKLPVTPNTLFAIGSCSKAFTSALLGKLREDEKIDFNESPRKYVPGLKFYNNEMNDQIIIKDLMSHRTGLPRHDYSWYLFQTFNRDSLVDRIQYLEPFAGVREQWFYNNFMFLLQGVIAEKLSGASWENNIRDKFFKPLSMTTSNVTIDELEKAAEPAIGYEVVKEKVTRMKYYDIAAMSPAGSINSSVQEMTRWVRTWIYGGKFEGTQIIPTSYVREAMSAQAVVSEGLPEKEHPDVHGSNYGYGWFLASYRGHYRVEHGGNIDGFSASTAFFPSDSLGVIVLTNQNNSVIPSVVRNMMADRALKLSRTNWSKELKDRENKNKAEETKAGDEKKFSDVVGTKPSHPLKDYAGRYERDGYGSFDIILRSDSLFAKFKTADMYLKHKHYDIFTPILIKNNVIDMDNDLTTFLNFGTSNLGEISMIRIALEYKVDPLEFKKAVIPAAVDKASLAKYEGEFVVGGMTARFSIKGEKTLTMNVPGQPEYELIPLGGNKFSVKTLADYKCEFAERNGKVTEVTFIQPNGTFVAKRK